MTKVEWKVWAQLRNRQLDGFKFRRQAPIGPYIADFVCFAARLIVEVDGPSHDLRLDYDARRTEWFNRQGFDVIRVTDEQVDQQVEGVVDQIRVRLTAPPPGLPDKRGGESPYRE